MKTIFAILSLTASILLSAEPGVVALSPGKHFDSDLKRAVDGVNAGQLSAIRFSPGEYRIQDTLDFRIPFGHPGLRLQGEGPGLSKLIFDGLATGIRVRLATSIVSEKQSPSFFLGDLSLLASGKCGTAVVLEAGNSDPRAGIAPKMCRNLLIEGVKGSWTGGIFANELTFCSFRDITLRLPRRASTGFRIGGASSPVDHHFSGIRMLGGETGIHVTGTVEGVYVDQITMIGTKTGIHWQTDSHEPLLSLTGSHINAISRCILAENLLQPVISGNLFYQADPESPWVGVEFVTKKSTPYDLLQISNNTFHGHPKHSKATTGLSIESASGGAITGNVFSALDTGIRLGQQANSIEPANCVFKNTKAQISGH